MFIASSSVLRTPITTFETQRGSAPAGKNRLSFQSDYHTILLKTTICQDRLGTKRSETQEVLNRTKSDGDCWQANAVLRGEGLPLRDLIGVLGLRHKQRILTTCSRNPTESQHDVATRG